jgi:hypothetical protein
MDPRVKIKGTVIIIFDPPPTPGPVQITAEGILIPGGQVAQEGVTVDAAGEVRCIAAGIDAERERLLQERGSAESGLRVEFTSDGGDRYVLPSPQRTLLTPEPPDRAHLAYRGHPAEKQ